VSLSFLGGFPFAYLISLFFFFFWNAASLPLLTIPSGMIKLQDWNTIFTAASNNLLTIQVPVATMPSGQDINFLSSFSSRGPTSDGRYKPDICATGQSVMSARSDGTTSTPASANCPVSGVLTSMSGTSMATPVTSGAAAMVRQYFTEGWHVSGSPNPTAGITPSASLIKATLINSASPVGGTVYTATGSASIAVQVAPVWPSVLEGFGRLQLDRALQFAAGASNLNGVTDLSSTMAAMLSINSSLLPASPFSLKVFDNQAMTTGGYNGQCFNVQSFSVPLAVTLVWLEPASTTLSAILLINDLDLIVTHVASGIQFYGNMLFYNDTVNMVMQVIAFYSLFDELAFIVVPLI
jgi:hypothetical protein